MRLSRLLVAMVAPLLFAVPAMAQQVSFIKDVAPILVKQCQACHGAKDAKGEYQLQSFEKLIKAGASGTAAVVPGKPKESELLSRLVEKDASIRMPKDADKLPDAQIALIEKWITEGAKFDGTDAKGLLNGQIPKMPHDPAPEKYRVPVAVTALAFSPDGKELAAGGYREITIWNVADGKLLRRIGNVAQRTYAMQFSADGKMLAVASGTPGVVGEVRLYNPADGKLLADLSTMEDCAFGVAFSPDGKKLAACAADRTIRVFDVASSKQELLIEDHADWVLGVAWNNDGTKLASASRDKTAKVFDAKKGEALATFNQHGQPVYAVTFSPDGAAVWTGGSDNQIRIWNPADGKQISNIGGYGGEVYQLRLQGGMIYSSSADKTGRQNDAAKRAQVKSFGPHNDYVLSIASHEASKRAATGTFDGEIRIWNLDDGKQVLAFFAAPGYTPPAPAAPAK